jgi:hypothetical protein
MATAHAATAAITRWDGATLGGRTLEVNEAREREPRSDANRGGRRSQSDRAPRW